MFGDRRKPFSDPAKELEFDLVRHSLRMHFDSLMMLSTGLRVIGSGTGVSQMAWQIEHLTDQVCRDLDALNAILPESIDDADSPHDASVLPPPQDEGDSRRAGRGGGTS